MNVIQEIIRINEKELEQGLTNTPASWHAKYSSSAWIYIGNLPIQLTEGDVIAVVSQFGEVEDINLVREEGTGKSKGFCFVKYEDCRSCVLAVDNFNGIDLCDRQITVDHVKKYKVFSKDDEEEYKPSGPDGKGWGDFRVVDDDDKNLVAELSELESQIRVEQKVPDIENNIQKKIENIR